MAAGATLERTDGWLAAIAGTYRVTISADKHFSLRTLLLDRVRVVDRVLQ